MQLLERVEELKKRMKTLEDMRSPQVRNYLSADSFLLPLSTPNSKKQVGRRRRRRRKKGSPHKSTGVIKKERNY